MSGKEKTAAAEFPIARVLPLLPLAHLDREFDYLVPREMSDDAQPGVRVRIRFAGRLVDGYVIERVAASEHTGKLGWLDRVVSAERVLTPEISTLVSSVADRYAGTRSDVLRLAVPPRHARVEAETVSGEAVVTGEVLAPVVGDSAVDHDAWGAYIYGQNFVRALAEGRNPRAVWQALPGERWATRLAELATVTLHSGRSAVLLVPDQRDLDILAAACVTVAGPASVVQLSAGLGPAARYRRWLQALRSPLCIVVGTRSAVFAPVGNVGLIGVWDDGDDNYAEPRSPYPHGREVAMLRSLNAGCALVLGGFARTAEAQSLIHSGWAKDLVGSRTEVRARQPTITALADSDHALARDPGARAARLPAIAFDAARTALAAGLPVLVQVPRAGYVPSLACGKCRQPARCRRCNGPMSLPTASTADTASSPTCRWCGIPDANHRCMVCGSRLLRAVVVGSSRTAEELGRAFPGVPIHHSGGSDVLAKVPAGASLVVSTVGAEPIVDGGFGAALLLDGWALLGRADLRAAEETLRRWLNAAAMVRNGRDGGRVVVVAESDIPTVQSLVRWDPVGHAINQLEERTEVKFPPSVHVAVVDGSLASITELIESAELPAGTEKLGPVELPPGERPPAGQQQDGDSPDHPQRLLVRTPREAGGALARALAHALALRSARKTSDSIRVQIDPLRIG